MLYGRTVVSAAVLSVAISAIPIGAGADDLSYRASVEKWRQDRETRLKSDDGWLTVSGLFWLHEGENRFGSGAPNDILLSGESVPEEAGSFTFRKGKTVVHANRNANILLNRKLVQSAELHPDLASDRINLGDLTLSVHASGERYVTRTCPGTTSASSGPSWTGNRRKPRAMDTEWTLSGFQARGGPRK
jgi:hypothetical protein